MVQYIELLKYLVGGKVLSPSVAEREEIGGEQRKRIEFEVIVKSAMIYIVFMSI